MRVIDASSIIYGWDNYPIDQFLKLWDWMASEINTDELAIPQVAFQEVKDKAPECGDWLKQEEISRIPPCNAILRQAVNMQQLLGVSGDNYHPNGVGENDILIIATAKVKDCELITNENVQNHLPNNKKRYKIPAVCDLKEVGVKNFDFVQYFKQSRRRFF